MKKQMKPKKPRNNLNHYKTMHNVKAVHRFFINKNCISLQVGGRIGIYCHNLFIFITYLFLLQFMAKFVKV